MHIGRLLRQHGQREPQISVVEAEVRRRLIDHHALHAVAVTLLFHENDVERIRRSILHDHVFGVHLDEVGPVDLPAPFERMRDGLTERAPTKPPVQRVQLRDEIDEIEASALEHIVMRDDQARLPEKRIEREVLDPVRQIPSREDGERAVFHDGDVPEVPNRRVRCGPA